VGKKESFYCVLQTEAKYDDCTAAVTTTATRSTDIKYFIQYIQFIHVYMVYIHTRLYTYFTTYIQQILVFLPSFLTAAVYNPLSTVNKSFTLQTDDPMYAHTHEHTHILYYIYSCIQCALFCSSHIRSRIQKKIEICLNVYIYLLYEIYVYRKTTTLYNVNTNIITICVYV